MLPNTYLIQSFLYLCRTFIPTTLYCISCICSVPSYLGATDYLDLIIQQNKEAVEWHMLLHIKNLYHERLEIKLISVCNNHIVYHFIQVCKHFQKKNDKLCICFSFTWVSQIKLLWYLHRYQPKKSRESLLAPYLNPCCYIIGLSDNSCRPFDRMFTGWMDFFYLLLAVLPLRMWYIDLVSTLTHIEF